CDLPDDARERILAGRREESRDAASGTVSTPGENWVERARASADERDAFHWPLAFPDAFYDGNGSLRDDAGFDAVVGNPPYVNIERTPDDLAGYFRSEYDFARRRFDQYVLFAERALALTRPGGYHGFVVPDKLLSETYASALRRALLERHAVERIVDLRDGDVFADARTSPIAYTVRAHAGDGDRPNSDGDDSPNSDGSDADSVSGDSNRDAGGTGTVPVVALDGDPREVNRIPLDDFRDGDEYRIRLDWDERTAAVVERVEAGSVPASRLLYVSWGLQPGSADEFFRYGSRPDRPEARPLVKGGDVDRYAVEHGDGYVIYDPERLHRPAFPGLFETEKLLFREVAGDRGLVGSYDDDGYYTDHSVINCVPKTSLRGVDDAVLRERGVRFVEEPRADGDAGTADGRADAVGDGSEASDSGSGADDGESSGGAYDRDAVVYLDDLDRASSYSLKAVLGILNSSLVGFYYGRSVSGDLNVFPQHVRDLPLPDVRFGSERRRAETVAGIRSAVDRVPDGKSLHESDGVRERLAAAGDDALHDALAAVVDDRLALERERRDVEPSLGEYVDADLDDVGAHGATRQLGALGSHESPEGVEESVIGATTETHEGLRIGTVTCERTAPGRVVVAATVRYKPDSEARRETDAYGYTETGPVPATVVTDLPEPAADAVEAFVPVLTERSGFTGLARKSITPLDRLEALELPQPAAVAEGVSAYLDARERADRLADEAERAERLVDEVVFELYDLSDAEVDTVRGSDAVD
ncbi:MAG: Eco57I restriction-modification methylase domain-containing protein, partial [Haloarculaceae archaeon]